MSGRLPRRASSPAAALYGSISRASMRAARRRELTRVQDAPFEPVHEAARHPLAQPVLRAGAAAPFGGAGRTAVVRAELFDRLDEFGDAPAAGGDGSDNWWPPLTRRVRVEAEDRLDRRRQPIGAFAVGLVHDENIGDLHDAGLQRLDLITRAGHERHDRHVGGADDVDLVLTDADGFDRSRDPCRRHRAPGRRRRSPATGRRDGRASPCCE